MVKIPWLKMGPRSSGSHRDSLAWSLAGIVVGVLSWLALEQLNPGEVLPLSGRLALPVLLAILSAGLAFSRLRYLPWLASSILCAAVLVIAFTPVMRRPAAALVHADPLQHCPAVLALCASTRPDDGLMDPRSEERLLGALVLVREGWSPQILIDHFPPPRPSPLRDVEQQLAGMGCAATPVEDIGAARDTRDEAVMVARLERQRHWNQILVVTSPLHTTRVRLVFAHAGARVLVRPCLQRESDLSSLTAPTDRLRVFREWAHEELGLALYRWRGWI